MKRLSTTLFTITLLLLPVAVVAEHRFSIEWQSRLAIPKFEIEPDRHTPKYFEGTFLPPIIKKDATLSAEDNPVLIMSKVFIEENATLTLGPGVRVYVSENAGLEVAGRLVAVGEREKPILFSSNEEHPLNQTWLGLTTMPGGSLTMEHVAIESASPAVSCLRGSEALVTHSKITRTVMGVFITDNNCSVTNTVIRSLQDGVVVIGVEPILKGNTITARGSDVIYK